MRDDSKNRGANGPNIDCGWISSAIYKVPGHDTGAGDSHDDPGPSDALVSPELESRL